MVQLTAMVCKDRQAKSKHSWQWQYCTCTMQACQAYIGTRLDFCNREQPLHTVIKYHVPRKTLLSAIVPKGYSMKYPTALEYRWCEFEITLAAAVSILSVAPACNGVKLYH